MDESPPVEFRETMRHFQECPSCQQWSITLPCEKVREAVCKVDLFDLDRLGSKLRYHDPEAFLTAPSLEHVHCCPRCQKWLQGWAVELRQKYIEEMYGDFQTYRDQLIASFERNPSEAVPSLTELKQQPHPSCARLGLAPKPKRNDEYHTEYATPEAAVEAALRFLESHPMPERSEGEGQASWWQRQEQWVKTQGTLKLACISVDDSHFEERIKSNQVPSPAELMAFPVSADLHEFLSMTVNDPDKDEDWLSI